MKKWDWLTEEKIVAGAHRCYIKVYQTKGRGTGIAYSIRYYINRNKIFSKKYYTSSDDVIKSQKYPNTIEEIVHEFRNYCNSKELFHKFYEYFFDTDFVKVNKILNKILLNENVKLPWFYKEDLQWNKNASMSLFHDIFNTFSTTYEFLSDTDRFNILKNFSESVIDFYESQMRYVNWNEFFYDGDERIKKYLFSLKHNGIIRIARDIYISNLKTEEETEIAVNKEIEKLNLEYKIHSTRNFWIDAHLKNESEKIFETEIRDKNFY